MTTEGTGAPGPGISGQRVGLMAVLAISLLLGNCGGTLAQIAGGLQRGIEAQQSYNNGLERYKVRDYIGAIPLFQRALELEPTFDDAEAYLGWSFYHTGQYAEATLHFRQALTRQPRWEGLYDGLGWSRYRMGRYNLALESFQEALAIDPRFRDAAVGLAYSFFELGRYAEARPHLERLTREGQGGFLQSPQRDVEDVRSRLAWVLFYLGEYEQAKVQFSKAITTRPDWYGLHNGLGWTYLKLGDRGRARASFQRALQLKPDLTDARQGIRLAGP